MRTRTADRLWPEGLRLIRGPVAILLALSCTRPGDVTQPVLRVDVPDSAVEVLLGERADSVPAEVLTSIQEAVLSPGGRFVALIDRVPPFLRTFDRQERVARAFGTKGGGPGELPAAWGVEFLDDSTLLVLSASYRVERFRPDGRWLGAHRLDDTGLQFTSLAVGCGGRVFGYGVPRERRGLREVPWVHEIDLGEPPRARTLLSIPGHGFSFGWGGLNGFDAGERGVVLWHGYTDPEVGFWVPCEGGPPTIWDHAAGSTEELGRAFSGSGAQRGMAFVLPDTLFAGAAVRGGARIRARNPLEPGEDGMATTFRVVEGRDCREVKLEGEWRIHDAGDEGLLLARRDPYPIVVLLGWRWFEERLRRVDCVEGAMGSFP